MSIFNKKYLVFLSNQKPNSLIMKKFFFSICLIAITMVVIAQNHDRRPIPAPNHPLLMSKMVTDANMNAPKTLTCTDTLRYPQMKEQNLGASNFYTFTLWTADVESMSQTFLHSGATISVTGIEFFGRKEPTSTANVVVNAAVYNVNASNNPTTLITSGTITINDTNYNYRQVTFAVPASVTGNYAVVLTPTSTNGIVEFYLNNAVPAQTYDENLSRVKSSYYTGSAGAWVSVPVLTGVVAQFPTGPYDFEMLVAPKVSYSINTGFTATPNPVCAGTLVNFTNTTAPTSLLTNRMYNWSAFRNYFQSVPDSTYAWDMNGIAPLVWATNATFTYGAAATYNPELYTLGGLWASCLDSYTTTIVVNALPTVTLSTLAPVCSNGTPVTLSGGSPAGGTYSGTGVSGGVFNPAAAPTGSTITYAYTAGNGCSGSDIESIVVNTAPVVTFILSPNITCDTLTPFALSGGSPAGGTYSGLGVSANLFAPGVAGMGTHVITYTYLDGNLCSNFSTQNMTVDICSGMEEGNAISNLSISPNPATDQLNISFTNADAGTTSIMLYSPIGQLVYSTSTSDIYYSGTLNVSDYAKGLYILQITTASTTSLDKIILK